MTERRLLTLVGDPNRVSTWSGTPYFFLQAARRQGLLDGGIALDPAALRIHRAVWNAFTLVRTGSAGGFQYSRPFLNRLFAQSLLPREGTIKFITHFPLLPPVPWGPRWKVIHYIDATLKQNFEEYGAGKRIARGVREDALEREREAYHGAEHVVCMNRWAAESVIGYYDVPRERCHVIVPGANLNEHSLSQVRSMPAPPIDSSPLRLGFIGKDWRRKGLPLLLDVATTLVRRGISTEVVAIGPSPRDVPAHPLLRPLGFIDKHGSMERFARIVHSFHFGFLLSSVEASGMSTLECLGLGVPVIASNVGGLPDSVPEHLGFLFEPNANGADIADLVQEYVQKPEHYAALRKRVEARAPEFSWDKTVIRLAALLQHSRC